VCIFSQGATHGSAWLEQVVMEGVCGDQTGLEGGDR